MKLGVNKVRKWRKSTFEEILIWWLRGISVKNLGFWTFSGKLVIGHFQAFQICRFQNVLHSWWNDDDIFHILDKFYSAKYHLLFLVELFSFLRRREVNLPFYTSLVLCQRLGAIQKMCHSPRKGGLDKKLTKYGIWGRRSTSKSRMLLPQNDIALKIIFRFIQES